MYPSITDYISSLEGAADTLATLNYLRPVRKPNGHPFFSSGNFAVVFKMEDTRTGNHMALKCFLRDVPDRARRLRLIGEWIADNPSPYLLPMTYHPDELWVDCAHCTRQEFDVVMMPWVEGQTLGEYVRDCCTRADRSALGFLAFRFVLLAEWMLNQNMAHGDLKPDNIMVRADGHLALVDYDGFYVPAFAGEEATETGTPPYRHTRRQLSDFNLYLDDFSLLLLQLELQTLACFPDWPSVYSPTDALLACPDDINAPRQSKLFADIYDKGKPIHRTLLAELEGALKKPLIFTIRDLAKPQVQKTIQYNEPPDLIPYRKGNKWGFCDRNKKIVIDCVYDLDWFFQEGRASVKKDGKWGCLNAQGVTVIPFEYDDVKLFSEGGLARVRKDDKWGFVDRYGVVVIPLEYEDVEPFDKGLSIAKKNEKWGFINRHGTLVIPFQYEQVWLFSEGLVNVQENGKWGCVDTNGKIVIKPQYEYISFFKNGLAIAKRNNSWEFIDKNGTVVTSLEDERDRFSEDRISDKMASLKRDDKYGFIDEFGEVVIPFVYDGAKKFSEGLAGVKINGKSGFINKAGVVIIPFQYDYTQPFSEGLAAVQKDNKFGFIDKQGTVVIPFDYRLAYPFSQGLSGLARVEKDGKWGLIDKTGRTIVPFEYDSQYFDKSQFSEDKASIVKNGKWGYVDINGEVIIPCKYERVFRFEKGLSYVENNSMGFFIDVSGTEYFEE
ncbi:MAG: hypothetical protein EAZ91_09845 [Cytophagales bacterium]|nr:MAG: hypothetical protein EAZ91_09845 [Cytophagales bacterium]